MSNEIQATPAAKAHLPIGRRGLTFDSIESMWRFAECVRMSKMAPKGMDTVQQLVVALEMGAEIGLAPMAAIQNIAVINGRPSLWGDALLALCLDSPNFDEGAFTESLSGAGDQMLATCTVRRLPRGQLVKKTFSVADAKRAGLWGKAGPWTQYPQRMLQMRARAFALRDTFPDVLRGIHSAEEMRDLPQVHVHQETRTSLLMQDLTTPGLAVPDPEPEQMEPPFNPPTAAEVLEYDNRTLEPDPLAEQAQEDAYTDLWAEYEGRIEACTGISQATILYDACMVDPQLDQLPEKQRKALRAAVSANVKKWTKKTA